MMTTTRALALLCLAGASCGDDAAGRGSLEVRAYGEAFVEEGIPSSALSDGWAVAFTRFEVTLRDADSRPAR